jgi:pentatricopeptide repeat protein
MRVVAVRRWFASVPAAQLTDVTGDPSFKNFFDLLTLPSRSQAWADREKLLELPPSRDAFFGTRKATAGRLAELITVQVVHGNSLGALSSLREMMAFPGSRVELVHFNAVLAGFARDGNVKMFDELWQEAQERGLGPGDSFTFSSAAKCYMESGDVERALGVVQKAKEAKVVPSEVLYGALLSGFAQRGDFKVLLSCYSNSFFSFLF